MVALDGPDGSEPNGVQNCVSATLVSLNSGEAEWTLTNQCDLTVHVFWGAPFLNLQDAEFPPGYVDQNAMVARRPGDTNIAQIHWASLSATNVFASVPKRSTNAAISSAFDFPLSRPVRPNLA